VTATRRLAAILAADVAGYSRLMGADEEETHERLKAHLRELFEPKIKEHRGRIVKNTGDGLLAEFASVVEAVRCAVGVQRGMVARDPDVPEERRIRFRIGVNLGDVIVEEDDIFGDGVNIAARLEQRAETGGICISGTVRDHIGERLPFPFEDMGEQQVKNIARPVRVYALRPEAIAHLPSATVPHAVSISQAAAAPRLSIVVLPFANLGNDPEQQYFADGITEDLTTDLSRIAGMFVISRNTAFAYQGKRVDTKQVGRELNVRYVLEGSVRRLGDRVRVNAQLIDAATDAHLWAERFDFDMGDLFALQNDLTARIANTLNLDDMSDTVAADVVRAEGLAGQALAASPRSPLAHFAKGQVLRAQRRFEEAIPEYEAAAASNPNSVSALHALGQCKYYTGSTDETIRLMEQVIRLSPRDPQLGVWYNEIGQVRLLQSRVDEAIVWLERARSIIPAAPYVHAHLAAAYALKGETERAATELAEACRLSRDDRYSSIARY